ncbi:MAG: hypothetical protein AABZ45_11125 [Pseudomonadota bacterium]
MPFDVKHRLGWGGARNRGDRVTHVLALDKARAIITAAYAALGAGQPFTRFVTIHWTNAGIADDQAAHANERLMKLASDWARRKGARIYWAWVRENDAGDGSKGSHVHLLIACPRALPIGRMWRRWLRNITGQPYQPGTIATRTIGGNLGVADANRARYVPNLDRVIAYMVKGVTPADGAALGLLRTEPGGTVIGKRSAVCQALRVGRPSAR